MKGVQPREPQDAEAAVVLASFNDIPGTEPSIEKTRCRSGARKEGPGGRRDGGCTTRYGKDGRIHRCFGRRAGAIQ